MTLRPCDAGWIGAVLLGDRDDALGEATIDRGDRVDRLLCDVGTRSVEQDQITERGGGLRMADEHRTTSIVIEEESVGPQVGVEALFEPTDRAVDQAPVGARSAGPQQLEIVDHAVDPGIEAGARLRDRRRPDVLDGVLAWPLVGVADGDTLRLEVDQAVGVPQERALLEVVEQLRHRRGRCRRSAPSPGTGHRARRRPGW